MQAVHALLLLDQNWSADDLPGPTPAATPTTVSRKEEASRAPQLQFLHLLQQTGALLPGWFVREASFGLQNHGGRSSTSTRGGGSTERGVQGRRLVCGGAAGGAPAGLLVCGAGGSSRGGGCAGSGVSVTLVVSVVAFALSAAGAVDGAHIVVVAHITQGHILGTGGAFGQAKDVCRGVKAPPSSRPPVVGPVGADGAEVFFITVVSLEEE